MSNALLAPQGRPLADKVIPNVDVDRRRRVCGFLDPDDLKFSRLHSRHLGQVGFDFVEKSLAARYEVSRKPSSKDLEPTPRSHTVFLSW